MRAEELEQDGKATIDLLPHDELETESHTDTPRASLGHRLRTAREGLGLSRAEAATKLRLPLRVIARLEDDDYQGMDEGVYLRGYLSSYARLVGVPVVVAETAAAAHARVVPLVATGAVSRSRYLFDRYSVSATYLILTGLIVVPAVWLATHGGLEQNLARTTSLDSPTTIAVPPPAQTTTGESSDSAQAADTHAPAAPASEALAATTPVEAPKTEQMPVVASMTPFTAQPPAAAPVPEAVATAKTGAHSMTLKLKADSWVEIVDTDGTKLEYGILAGGTERTYSSDGPLSVRLGNAEGAEVDIDGKSLDLSPYRRANVARLRVFGPDGVEAPRPEY